jgi:hypothetical protein
MVVGMGVMRMRMIERRRLFEGVKFGMGHW